ncbi:hypothetical protein DEF97_015675 [Xanthomonas vasicola]|nr:hypothetical protein DEF97_015675 [Xanthomonas vasicola]
MGCEDGVGSWGFGIRDSGFGIRDSGIGNRESGIGNRESSGKHNARPLCAVCFQSMSASKSVRALSPAAAPRSRPATHPACQADRTVGRNR